MDFEELRQLLSEILKNELPGEKAQFKMAPEYRYRGPHPNGSRKAAVLLLLYPVNNKFYLALIKRTPDDSPHSQQVSIPGGMQEITDSSLLFTALREFYEETGWRISSNEVIGVLTSLYIEVSNIEVHPFLALTNIKPIWSPDPVEVDYIIEFPVEYLFNEKSIFFEKKTFDNQEFLVPYFKINEDKVWGATAMIMSELSDIINFKVFKNNTKGI